MKINSLKNRANPPIFRLQKLICSGLLYPGSLVMFFSQPNFFSKHGKWCLKILCSFIITPIPKFYFGSSEQPKSENKYKYRKFHAKVGEKKMFSCLLGTSLNLLVRWSVFAPSWHTDVNSFPYPSIMDTKCLDTFKHNQGNSRASPQLVI